MLASPYDSTLVDHKDVRRELNTLKKSTPTNAQVSSNDAPSVAPFFPACKTLKDMMLV